MAEASTYICSSGQLYSGLPASAIAHGDKLGLPVTNEGTKKNVVQSYLKQHLPANRLSAKEDNISRSQIPLSNPIHKKRFTPSKHRKKKLSNKERKGTNAFKIPKENQRYDQHLALHHAWRQYMEEVIPSSRLINPGEVKAACQKVLKAEFQGSILTVQCSKCPSYVGTTGIVLQESRHIFTFITSNNTVKCVPKMNSIFTLEWGGQVFTIHGNHLKVKAGERSSKSFKSKPTVDL